MLLYHTYPVIPKYINLEKHNIAPPPFPINLLI